MSDDCLEIGSWTSADELVAVLLEHDALVSKQKCKQTCAAYEDINKSVSVRF